MTITIWPEVSEGFTSPVEIPVVFEDTVSLESTLIVLGATTLSSSLVVLGDTTLSSAVICNSTINVQGSATFDSDVSCDTLDVASLTSSNSLNINDTFTVSNTGVVTNTANIGGTGTESEPSIAAYDAWEATVVQSSGTSVSNLTVKKAFWQRVGNLVTCFVFIDMTQPTITSTETQQFKITNPMSTNFNNSFSVVGSSCVDITSSAFVNGMFASIKASSSDNTAVLSVRIPATSGSLSVETVYAFRVK